MSPDTAFERPPAILAKTEMSRTVPNSENKLCDNDHTPDAMREFERYCETHSNGPAAVRRPKLLLRGKTYIVLLGNSVADGIVGLGATVSAAVRAFDLQYLKTIRPPKQ